MDNYNEINKQYALEMEPVYGLQEHLALRSQEDLASLKSLTGTENVYGWLCDPENFKMVLTALPAADFDLFSRAANATFLQDDKVLLPRHTALSAFSLITAFISRGNLYMVVPSELKALWRDLSRLGYKEYKNKRDMLDTYAFACIKLYGVISLDEFIEIFNLLSGGKTNLKEAEDYFKELADGEYYRVSGGFIYHTLLPEEGAQDYIKARQGKPRYLPRHEKMLQFGEGSYYDVFHELEIYRLECEDIIGSEGERGYDFIDTLYMMLSTELCDQSHDELFEGFGLTEDKERIRELKNNVRLWVNYGHTPKELFDMMEKGTYRPERNGACPCGSGKKYKKCHA
jgi:hypothetical protein